MIIRVDNQMDNYKVMIEYPMDNITGQGGEAETFEEAMKKADDYNESQRHFETYVGDITRAYVIDHKGKRLS
jgi:hypothetical protein